MSIIGPKGPTKGTLNCPIQLKKYLLLHDLQKMDAAPLLGAEKQGPCWTRNLRTYNVICMGLAFFFLFSVRAARGA